MSLRDRLLETDLISEQNPAWYDGDLIEQWKENLPMLSELINFRPLPRRYKSNWRILHIDWFEARTVQFFKPMSGCGFDIPAGATQNYRQADNLGGYPERCVHGHGLSQECKSCGRV